jgi:hypothetical protein
MVLLLVMQYLGNRTRVEGLAARGTLLEGVNSHPAAMLAAALIAAQFHRKRTPIVAPGFAGAVAGFEDLAKFSQGALTFGYPDAVRELLWLPASGFIGP